VLQLHLWDLERPEADPATEADGDLVALTRVDAILETIRRYYDKPDLRQDLDRRRGAMADFAL
jgi:hypothetical protein